MDWIFPSIIATLTGTFVLAFVYSYLSYTEKQSCLKKWSISWWLYGLRFVFMLWILLSGTHPLLIFGNQFFSLISGLILLWGTYEFMEEEIPRYWFKTTGIITVWILYGSFEKLPFLIFTLPTFTFLGLIYIWSGLIILRKSKIMNAGSYITGLTFLFWGLHKFNYPFIKSVEWLAPWGYLLASIIELIAAFGILMMYFEQNKYKLEETLENLKVNEHIMKESQKIAHIGSWHFDISNNKLFWSDEMYRIFGREPQSFKATYEDFLKTIHPDDLEMVDETYKNAINNNIPYECVHRIVRDDGKVRVVREKSEDIVDENGNTIHSYGYSQDITEKFLENERYQLITKAALDGFCLVDEHGNFIDVNETYCNISGFTREELLKKNIAEVEACETPEDIQKRVKNIFKNKWDRFETKHLRKDGVIIDVEVSIRLIYHVEAILVVFIRDISKIKKGEKKRLELENKLTQAHKMEAVGTLAGGIAHDFNNLLSIIMGFSEIARDDAGDNIEIIESLDNVIEAGNRAKYLVSQILTFSRQESVEKISINAAEHLKNILEFLRSTIPKTIEIVCNIDKNTGNIMGDPIRFQQIIMNLCTNAIHAIGNSKGKIEITLSISPVDSKKLSNYNNPECIKLTVSDNGCGISDEISDRIFDPYFTTKEMGTGTGMGLSIIHGIIKDYGGTIDFKTELNKGTSFQIYFPVTDQETTGPSEDLKNKYIKGKGCILFIDDEPMMVELGKKMIEKLGYEVVVENGSISALERYRNNHKKFDLIITDQTMPEMTGIELSEKIREINSEISIILCSGYSDSIDEKKLENAGINEYLQKPVTMKTYSQVLKKFIPDN